MENMNNINIEDLVKNQDTDAQKWAAAFIDSFKGKNQPDESDMIGWFANAMMTMHDKTSNTTSRNFDRKEKELRAETESETNRCLFWEKRARELEGKYSRTQILLTEAHAIIGRSAHALSHRWDTMPLTTFMSGISNDPAKKTVNECQDSF